MAVSFQCMTKFTTNKKIKIKKNKPWGKLSLNVSELELSRQITVMWFYPVSELCEEGTIYLASSLKKLFIVLFHSRDPCVEYFWQRNLKPNLQETKLLHFSLLS